MYVFSYRTLSYQYRCVARRPIQLGQIYGRQPMKESTSFFTNYCFFPDLSRFGCQTLVDQRATHRHFPNYWVLNMLHIRCTNFCINILYITFFEIRKFCKSIKRSCHNAIWIGLFICCLQCNEKWGLNKLAIEKYEIKRSRDQVNYYEFRNSVRSKVDGLL